MDSETKGKEQEERKDKETKGKEASQKASWGWRKEESRVTSQETIRIGGKDEGGRGK